MNREDEIAVRLGLTGEPTMATGINPDPNFSRDLDWLVRVVRAAREHVNTPPYATTNTLHWLLHEKHA